MAFRNINTIQNPETLSYILSYTNEYMYESLANLGQRFSIKGDGLKTESFDTLQLVNKKQSDFVYPDGTQIPLISKLSIINDKLFLQFFDINNIYVPLYSEEIQYTYNNLVISDAPIQLNQKINGVDYYKENMYVYLDDIQHTLNIASLGCSNDSGVIELNIEKYNIYTNTLVESLKLIDEGDVDNYFVYYLYDDIIKVDENGINNDTDTDYVIYKYKVSKSYIDGLYSNFQQYALSIYNSIIREYYNEYHKLNIKDIFSELINTGYINALPNSNNPIPVSYDEEVQGFYVEGEYESELNPVLSLIYNQLVYMYKFMFEYYCDYVYKLDNNQLNKYIVFKIYNKAFNDSGIYNINTFEMFIPVDYKFDYYCKDSDTFFIYSNETPINIFYTINKLDQTYINNYVNNKVNTSNIIITNHISVEKVVLYKFNIDYNRQIENVINTINVVDTYATPYILDNYWVINNQLTKYKAIGEDANNPNIILVYTKNVSNKSTDFSNNDYQLLSTINADLLNSLSWTRKTVYTNLLEGIDTSNKKYITKTKYNSYVLVPDNIVSNKSNVINQLKGSLIINMSDINNVVADTTLHSGVSEKTQIKEILGNNSFITSFWVFDNISYTFSNVKNPNTNDTLTLSNLNNINNIIYNQTQTAVDNKFKNFNISDSKFTYAVFNTGYTVTKNSFNKLTYSYAVLYNNVINDINLNLNTWDSNTIFNNPFIFTLRYVDNITNEGLQNYNRYIPGVLQTSDLKVKANRSLALNTLSKVEDTSYITYFSYDYTPSIATPLVDFGEVLSRNINALNRTNIISVDELGDLYYSYIGNSINENNKSTLHIGTSNLNINVGTDSLFEASKINTFKKHDKISIDFDSIILNSKKTQLPNKNIKKISSNLRELNFIYNYDINNDNYAKLCIKGNTHEQIQNYELVQLSANTNVKLVHTYTGIPKFYNENAYSFDLVLIPINDIIDYCELNIMSGCEITSNMDIVTIPNVSDGIYLLTKREEVCDTNFIDIKVVYVENYAGIVIKLDIHNNHFGNEILPCELTVNNMTINKK